MRIFGRGDLGPVGRFSLALAGILLITAVGIAGLTSYLLDRYVQDETTRFTREAVASHFGPVFEEDVFQRPLATEERDLLKIIVSFHFSIYNVVRTQFFDTKGTIVFSYDESEIGRRIDPANQQGLAAALAGTSYATRTDVVGDSRYAALGAAASYVPTASGADGDHAHATVSGASAPAHGCLSVRATSSSAQPWCGATSRPSIALCARCRCRPR